MPAARPLEDKNEHHFSRVKEGSKGCLNLKAALFSTQRLHWLQRRYPQTKKQEQVQNWDGLTDTDASRIAKKAFQTATMFAAVLEVGVEAEEIASDMSQWYSKSGQKLIFQFEEALVALVGVIWPNFF